MTDQRIEGAADGISGKLKNGLGGLTGDTKLQVEGPAAGIAFKPSGLIDSQQQLKVTSPGGDRYVCVLISGVVSIKKVAC